MTSLAEAALDTSSATSSPASEAARFVINLCSSTTPMALVQPKTEELRKFTFFVSRRREEGRERFRLHMGYFATAEEGEEWLSAVRDVYPGAWVGEAPGKKLRGAAAEAARRAPIVSAPPPAMNLLFDDAAPVAAPAPVVPAVVLAPAAATPVAPPPKAALVTPAAVVKVVEKTAERPVEKPVKSAPVAVAPIVPKPVVQAPVEMKSAAIDTTSLSNVREVIASLDFDAPAHVPTLSAHVPTVQAVPTPSPKAAPTKAPVASVAVAPIKAAPVAPKPAVQPKPVSAHKAVPAQKAVAAPKTATPVASAVAPSLSDSQVLRVLEERRADNSVPSASDSLADTAIALVRPEDTQTLRALKADLQSNAPAQFAVQLDWSVTPLDITKVPPLAIFTAYTLYTVETTRDGRTWYGLRLGFFTDAISAKQVAFYVRSDFASVSVVPVSAIEKSNATADSHDSASLGTSKDEPAAEDEFKLFDLEPAAARVLPGVADAVNGAAANTAKPSAATKAPASRSSRRPARGKARTNHAEESLEQTLEILGASDLAIDNGRGELLNDSGVRHLSVKVDKRTSTFSKLLDRLSDRMSGR